MVIKWTVSSLCSWLLIDSSWKCNRKRYKECHRRNWLQCYSRVIKRFKDNNEYRY